VILRAAVQAIGMAARENASPAAICASSMNSSLRK
jgi:hypothetical protein